VSGYVVVETEQSVVFPPDDPVSVSLACPAGTNVVGGGGELMTRSPGLSLQGSHPQGDAAWRVTFVNQINFDATADVRVTAICITAD
jgi:hypothetical protein